MKIFKKIRSFITKKNAYRILFFVGIIAILTYLANQKIISNAQGRTFVDVSEIPYNKVGLVLGTAKYLANGKLNMYYMYRVEAAVKLFKAGKIDYILISGDNHSISTDEPTDFKNSLIEKGIPAERIYLDYAGFRTLDSVVRAKVIFGQESVTFISQKFHNERAIYLADSKNMTCVGFNATNVSAFWSIRVQLREYLARVKVFWDLFFEVQPKFYGEKIPIGS